jgi:hypothetical protein
METEFHKLVVDFFEENKILDNLDLSDFNTIKETMIKKVKYYKNNYSIKYNLNLSLFNQVENLFIITTMKLDQSIAIKICFYSYFSVFIEKCINLVESKELLDVDDLNTLISLISIAFNEDKYNLLIGPTLIKIQTKKISCMDLPSNAELIIDYFERINPTYFKELVNSNEYAVNRYILILKLMTKHDANLQILKKKGISLHKSLSNDKSVNFGKSKVYIKKRLTKQTKNKNNNSLSKIEMEKQYSNTEETSFKTTLPEDIFTTDNLETKLNNEVELNLLSTDIDKINSNQINNNFFIDLSSDIDNSNQEKKEYNIDQASKNEVLNNKDNKYQFDFESLYDSIVQLKHSQNLTNNKINILEDENKNQKTINLEQNNQISELKEENKNQKKENENLNNQISELKEENKNQKKENENLNNQISELKEENKNQNNQISDLKKENENLNNEVKILKGQVETINFQLEHIHIREYIKVIFRKLKVLSNISPFFMFELEMDMVNTLKSSNDLCAFLMKKLNIIENVSKKLIDKFLDEIMKLKLICNETIHLKNDEIDKLSPKTLLDLTCKCLSSESRDILISVMN